MSKKPKIRYVGDDGSAIDIFFDRALNLNSAKVEGEYISRRTANGEHKTNKIYSLSSTVVGKELIRPETQRELAGLERVAALRQPFTLVIDDNIGFYADFSGARLETTDSDKGITARGSSGMAYNPDRRRLVHVGSNKARFEAGAFTGRGLLCERASLNACLETANFTATGWTATNATVTNNTFFTKDLFGGTDAALIVATAANGFIRYTSTTATGGKGVASVWLKTAGDDLAGTIRVTGTGGGSVQQNITITNKWQRFHAGAGAVTLSGNLQMDIVVGAAGVNCYVAHPNLEPDLSYPTSFIPQGYGDWEGAAGSRAHESYTINLAEDTVDSYKGELSFYITPKFTADDGLTHRILSLRDPDNFLNLLRIEKLADGNLSFSMDNPIGTGGLSIPATAITDGEKHYVSFMWDMEAGRTAAFIDGTLITEALGVVLAPVDDVRFLHIGDPDGSNESANMIIDNILLKKCVDGGDLGVARDYDREDSVGIHRNRWNNVILLSEMNFEEINGTDKYNFSMEVIESFGR